MRRHTVQALAVGYDRAFLIAAAVALLTAIVALGLREARPSPHSDEPQPRRPQSHRSSR